jgi:hypothetical protein
LKQYVIKSRQAEIYVPERAGYVKTAAQARIFRSLEIANGYRMQRTGFPDGFVVCEMSGDGQITPVEPPT